LKPRLIALNLLLLAGIGTSLWLGRARWRDAEAQRRNALDVKISRVTPPPVSPAPVPEAPPATKYVDVATKDLFSKDRNPTVIIEPPKPEKVREMPSLPVVYGVLGLPSGVKALMAEKPGLSTKSVRAGDTIGEFTIAALDPRSVTFVWEGKEVQKQIEDLMDRANSAAPAGPQVSNAAQPLPSNATQVGVPTQVQQPQSPNTPPPQNNPGGAVIGGEMGAPGHSERGCRPGDNSPAGAVVEGYRKVLISTPFGTNCRWVPAQ
jgi:hypothetical protein